MADKRQLRRLTSKVAQGGFGSMLHQHNLTHLLPFFQFRKHQSKSDHAPDARALSELLTSLGPGFVEIGKIMASRSDLIAQQYQAALLNNKTQPSSMSSRELKRIIRNELGRSTAQTITYIEPEPYFTGVISQTHKAVLADGRRVLVTLADPVLREALESNVEQLAWLYEYVLDQFSEEEQEIWGSVWEELQRRTELLLDFTKTAGMYEILGAGFEENQKTSIPQILWEYTTPTVLTQRWRQHPSMHDITHMSARAGMVKRYVAKNLVEALIYQYGVVGVFMLRPSTRSIQIKERNALILNNALATGYLEPQERKQFCALLYALLLNEPELAAKVLLLSRYSAKTEQYFSSGMRIPTSKSSSVSERIWELLEYGWYGKLHIPLGFSMAAESILYLEHALHQFDSEISVGVGLGSALKKYIPEIFGVKKTASVKEIVTSVLG
jgi:ubiquinone biosynthesis protein